MYLKLKELVCDNGRVAHKNVNNWKKTVFSYYQRLKACKPCNESVDMGKALRCFGGFLLHKKATHVLEKRNDILDIYG